MDLVRVRFDRHEFGVHFRGFWSVFWWDWGSWIYSCGYSWFTPDYDVWVLMVLLVLIIRRRGILDFILLEDVLLFIHFGIRWPSWSWGYIFSVSWLVLDYFSFRDRMRVISVILVTILYVRSFMVAINRLYLLVT